MKNVLLNWQLSSNFGWGILGLNIFSHWANDPEITPYMGQLIRPENMGGVDSFRVSQILRSILRSNQISQQLTQTNLAEFVSIDALGNGFTANGTHYNAGLNIARCIFEDTSSHQQASNLEKYDLLLTASNWNASLIEACTQKKVHIILEGVDTTVFFPGPRSGLGDPNKFYIFSGGKAEFRKGQDLVLKVFKAFSKKCPDAMLVVCWQSLWPNFSVGLKGVLDVELKQKQDGSLDIHRWCDENGIDSNRVIDIGMVANSIMPYILREMDVSIQPSRAEACTNLLVKEAMACGVPVIAGLNTGMHDILTPENSIPLTRQKPVPNTNCSTEGWGESDFDEMYAALEKAYHEREWLKSLGLRASSWISENNRTWKFHAAELKKLILQNI